MIARQDTQRRTTLREHGKQPRQLSIDISKRGGLCLRRVLLGRLLAGSTRWRENAIRLMERGNIDEQKNALRARQCLQPLTGERDLSLGRMSAGHSHLLVPMTLVKQIRQHASQG